VKVRILLRQLPIFPVNDNKVDKPGKSVGLFSCNRTATRKSRVHYQWSSVFSGARLWGASSRRWLGTLIQPSILSVLLGTDSGGSKVLPSAYSRAVRAAIKASRQCLEFSSCPSSASRISSSKASCSLSSAAGSSMFLPGQLRLLARAHVIFENRFGSRVTVPTFQGAGGVVSRHPSVVGARVFAPGCRRRFAALRALATLGPQPATIRTPPERASWQVRLRPSSENPDPPLPSGPRDRTGLRPEAEITA
jgi:hypothetical protein